MQVRARWGGTVCTPSGRYKGRADPRPSPGSRQHVAVYSRGMKRYSRPFPIGVSRMRLYTIALFAIAACNVSNVTFSHGPDAGSGGADGSMSDAGTQGFGLELLAGHIGGPGNLDGTGAAARFAFPLGVAVDSAGNVYVADQGNSTIRKVTAAGVVTTLAGTAGMPGSADGTGAEARFSAPMGVAVDSAGNVYVAEGTSTIRKVTAAGVVTTLAGTAGMQGSADGTGAAARFSRPTGVAVDSAGNVYVADQNNFTIRKVTAAGVVTTLAGTAGMQGSADGTGAAARFSGSSGVAVDSAGNVYVAEGTSTIRKVTAAGVVTTLAGAAGMQGSADGTGAEARFVLPWGVAVDSAGNVYVADTNNFTIRKVTAAGVVTTLAGAARLRGSEDGTGAAARFAYPWGVAVDSAGNVYVADQSNSTIRKVTAAGVVTTLAGTAGTGGSADGTGAEARFFNPWGVAVDSAGNVYVADANNATIRKVTAAGVVTTLAGTAGMPGSADGTGAEARFSNPSGVAVDSAGNVYVADRGNSTIRRSRPPAS
ncbi:MAG: NHL repeat-containing protein [Kofleriaceae bacterium]